MPLYIDVATDLGIWLWQKPDNDPSQPHVARIAAALVTPKGEVIDRMCRLITPQPGWPAIAPRSIDVHGIDEADRQERGSDLAATLTRITMMASKASMVVGHSLHFHLRALGRAFADAAALPLPFPFNDMQQFCTMQGATKLVALRLPSHTRLKWPTLGEAYKHFTGAALMLPADPIARGDAVIDAVRAVHQGILWVNPAPAA